MGQHGDSTMCLQLMLSGRHLVWVRYERLNLIPFGVNSNFRSVPCAKTPKACSKG
jgi:hypothetical protein